MPPHHRATARMVKLWSGNRDLHFECGVYPRRSVVELGLHFESDPITNLRLLGAFRARAKRIARALPDARIEPWDRGWARVWEPIALEVFDPAFSARLTERLAAYVRTLAPILEAEVPADTPWSR